MTAVKTYAVLGLALLLAGCGKEAVYQDKTVTEWKEALRADDAELRLEAAKALAKLGRDAKEAVPDLAAALKDDDEKVRAQAAEALWAMADAATDAIPALVDALKDKSADVRMHAAGALGVMGKEGRAAIPDLIAALPDKDPDVISAIARVLGRMGSAAKDAVPEMSKLLSDQNLTPLLKDRQKNAAEERDDRNKIKVCVANALAEMGPDAAEAVPALTAMAKEPDPQVHGAALGAIRTIQAKK